MDADCNISTAGNPLIHELNLSNDTSYTNFVSAIEAKKWFKSDKFKSYSKIISTKPQVK